VVGVFVANRESASTRLGPVMSIDEANLLVDPSLARVDIRATSVGSGPGEMLLFCTHCGAYAVHAPDGGHEKREPLLAVPIEVTPDGLRVLDPQSGTWTGPYSRDTVEEALASTVARATGKTMKRGRDTHYQGMLGRLDRLLGTAGGGEPVRGPTLMTIDLNRMLRPADRARLLLWKEM